MPLLSTVSTLAHHARTIVLFTEADLKTSYLPILCFSLALAPVHSVSCALRAACWLWIHLLQFSVANQVHAVHEDTINKAYRPLPAKRITVQNAAILRWALVPICFGFSLLHSAEALYASATFVALTFIYNELHVASGFWVFRNILNGMGFAAFEWGTTLMAGADGQHLNSAAQFAIFSSAAIITTTIQVQDFRDVVGDALVGRATFPLVSERWARMSVVATVIPWSLALSKAQELDGSVAALFVFLGAFVGLRFLMYRSARSDETSYVIYNIWLSCAHVLAATGTSPTSSS
ncbi:uncharacterized protein PHACADRAFT_212805 [Phanerochaete carnosa HHB-10118-sp]|uniref:UbiA prenyltransferase n=1 Tax=Phanerochaete carnosa (strain HHB-10118-sp) TaxID=650164 RepID=K5VWB8_PHACS|nr:uncharacterized protein PHACADRAFT_212805 [Phanerochaete carnosa HHB-10118-sp]EKM50879.1 hypothetical protein PHACADRAFT_212805 [Phanerochaete carnosa HHB-10118-sp]